MKIFNLSCCEHGVMLLSRAGSLKTQSVEHESRRIQFLGMMEVGANSDCAKMKPCCRLLKPTLVSGSVQLDA